MRWQVEYALDDEPIELVFWEDIELIEVLAVAGWLIDKYEPKSLLPQWN